MADIDMRQMLTTALLRKGQSSLAEIWGVDSTTVGKRLTDQLGMKLSEFCAALDALGIRVIGPDEDSVTISRKRYEALRELARDGLEQEL